MDRNYLKSQQRKIVASALVSAAFCSAILYASYLLLPRYFSFPKDMAGRLALAAQLSMFVLIWVVIGVRMVSRVRFYSPEDMNGSAYTIPSDKIAVPRAFLQNTVEQAMIAVGALVALATLLSGPPLALLPAAVFLFGIGRIAFLWGYPKGAAARAFGMVTTVLPFLAGYILSIALIIAGLI